MLVLEGPQGFRKSSVAQALFGVDWHTDHIPDLHSKDAALQIQGKWILEHAEMATLSRTDANRAKEFISRRVDRFRPPYDKLTADFKRQCVFLATLNPSANGYLKDETGARRFWPVKCGAIWPEGQQADAEAVAAARSQLWAEAVARYNAGQRWWLDTRALEAAQAETAEARFDADAWHDLIREFVADKPYIRVGEVLSQALAIVPRDQSKQFQMRVGAVLHTLGWRRKRIRLDGVQHWLFTRGNDTPQNVVAWTGNRTDVGQNRTGAAAEFGLAPVDEIRKLAD
jgi:predicted P-loop ATPase